MKYNLTPEQINYFIEHVEALIYGKEPPPMFVCCICDGIVYEYGNNPWPVLPPGEECCKTCNDKHVTPARIVYWDKSNDYDRWKVDEEWRKYYKKRQRQGVKYIEYRFTVDARVAKGV